MLSSEWYKLIYMKMTEIQQKGNPLSKKNSSLFMFRVAWCRIEFFVLHHALSIICRISQDEKEIIFEVSTEQIAILWTLRLSIIDSKTPFRHIKSVSFLFQTYYHTIKFYPEYNIQYFIYSTLKQERNFCNSTLCALFCRAT